MFPVSVRILLPIRRDMFPKKLPFHSGMGCFINPTLCRHTFSFLTDNTFVNMSDPFLAAVVEDSRYKERTCQSRVNEAVDECKQIGLMYKRI